LVAVLVVMPGVAESQVIERLYEQACADGDWIACNIFGLMHEHGDGASQDPRRAASLYRRACEGGLLVGCTNLALMYEAGAGVAQDSDRAAGLYRVACEGGELLACDLVATVEQAGAVTELQRFAKAGRVGDAETGVALSEAIIEVPSLGVKAISGPDGRFALGRLPPGRYTLRAERFGYEAVHGELPVPGNAEVMILLTRAPLDDPRAPGRIEGRVTGGGSQGLSNVEIQVLGQPRASTLTNQQGRFVLRDIQPGLAEVRFTLLGYAPRTATLLVQPGRTAEIAAAMATEPIELEPIQVSVRSSFLDRNGFYRRMNRGSGHQMSRLDLDNINPVLVSDAVERVPGVRLQVDPLDPNRRFAVSRRASSFALGACVLGVYVDGVRMADLDLNQLPQEWLEGMEVYVGVGTPVQYKGRDPCGVVLFWTHR
jgi:hypothetical protein